MIKHIEIKTHEFAGIKVMVLINYNTGKVSLVENLNNSSAQDKRWVFAGREIEYFNGWINVLHAMEYAIEECRKDLEAYQKEKENYVTNILMEATDIVKKRSSPQPKKKKK